MTKRIYKAICMAALSVFVVTMVLIMGVMYDYFTSLQQSQLSAQTELAAQGVDRQGMTYFDGLNTENFRITWIAANGDVLYDSVSDSVTMENHLQREEIHKAIHEGFGESSRYSSTLMKRYLYCAQRLSDGTVLRLSISQKTVLVLAISMLQPILIVIAVAAILSFVLASGLSRRIVEPMNRLNLDSPLENEGYEELSPLFHRIYSQQQQLAQQKSVLTQKQNELDAIVAHLEEGMILLDKDGKILTVNQSALRLLERKTTGIVLGANILTLSRNPQLQEAIEEAMGGSTATQKTILHGRTVRIQAAAVGSETQMSGVAVVLFDITEAEQAEQRRKEFTANVSHELKTPLQSISGYSELIKCGMARPEDIQPFAERIYGESQRLIRLVEDIINLSHLDEGGSYEWKPLDLYEAAAETMESMAGAAMEKQVHLSLEGAPVEIVGVGALIHGILYNLCDNAIKYNRPGGEVALGVTQEDGFGVLTVKDTGIGIPEEERDRIFERFYRVDKSRSKEVGGTGLGLSIVKHAAAVLHADIQVDSTLGEGSTIRVQFPMT